MSQSASDPNNADLEDSQDQNFFFDTEGQLALGPQRKRKLAPSNCQYCGKEIDSSKGLACQSCYNEKHRKQRKPNHHSNGKSSVPPQDYVCNICKEKGHFIRDCPQKSQAPRKAPRENAPCWFCLSNPDIEKHLLVAIGEEFYLAIPKGGVVDNHILIVPISHITDLRSGNEETKESLEKLEQELERYKQSLESFFIADDLVPVYFEVSRPLSRNQHFHIQVIPVKKSLIEETVKLFIKEFDTLEWAEEDSLPASHKSPYVKVNIPGCLTLVHTFSPDEIVDLQFGRRILCKILGLEDCIEWKNCVKSKEEERKMAREFKQRYSKFETSNK